MQWHVKNWRSYITGVEGLTDPNLIFGMTKMLHRLVLGILASFNPVCRWWSKNYLNLCDARFEVVMTVLLRMQVLWDVTLSMGELFPTFWRYRYPPQCWDPRIQQYSITFWMVWILSGIRAQSGKYLLLVLGLFCGIFRRLYIKFDTHSNDFQCCNCMVSWEKRCFNFSSLWRWEVPSSYKMLLSVYQTVWCQIP